jgi:hypothetical protein
LPRDLAEKPRRRTKISHSSIFGIEFVFLLYGDRSVKPPIFAVAYFFLAVFDSITGLIN